jgi:tetratricopeptide (TPR) repeat protein
MTRWFASLVLGAALLGLATPAALADPPTASPVKEAAKHFHRGVTLYNEADYRGALIEFKRAYEIAPNASVLYNVGETYFQLQNYAAALSVLERYLNEAGATAPHRREVEQTLETLRTRVGNVQITTNVPDCEITVDDDLIGKTPLKAPVVASVGRRKITAMHTGRAPETRFVEVSAGDTTEIALSLTELARPAAGPAVAAPGEAGGVNLVKVGWITTGALAAGTVATGIWAYVASRQLDDARHKYPANGADLDSKSSRASTLALVADVVGAATLVAGAVTLKLTLSRSSSHEVHVAVVPGGIQIAGAFR